MANQIPVTNLIQKIVDSSFFVNTPKGKVRVVKGDLFYYPDKYFYLKDVIGAILHLYKFYDQSKVNLDDLHDLLYTSEIVNKEVLNAIKTITR